MSSKEVGLDISVSYLSVRSPLLLGCVVLNEEGRRKERKKKGEEGGRGKGEDGAGETHKRG